jgi:DNA-binding CsgD family transcriptional regulator
MQRQLPGSHCVSAYTTGHSLIGAVSALGEPEFLNHFLGALHAIAGVNLVAAYSIDETGIPSLRYAQGEDDDANRFADTVSQRYASLYWRHDPAMGQLLATRMHIEAPVLYRQSWDQIPPSEYRTVCYESPGVVDRVSLMGDLDGTQIVVNSYRRSFSGRFKPSDIERLTSHAELVIALIGKHARLTGKRNPSSKLHPDAKTIQQRLAANFPALSLREREVCSGLLMGMSVKEIARLQGLELSSVITYKRRAYTKLDITDRRALVAAYTRD